MMTLQTKMVPRFTGIPTSAERTAFNLDAIQLSNLAAARLVVEFRVSL